MLSGIALTSIISLVAFSSCVNAHGYLEEPKPTWTDTPNPGWIVNINNYWDIGSGGDQCGTFKTMAKEKGVTVKDVVLDMVGKDKQCGNTLADASPQPVPTDGKAKWHGNEGGGFTHVGPCEIYLDDKMVLHGDNCEEEYKGGAVGSTQASEMPVDYSSCNGGCTLTIYWLAFQNEQWQAYVNCVPLTGSGSSTPSSLAGTEASAASSGKQTTEAPSTDNSTTESSAASSGKQTTEAPSTDNSTTESSAASSGKQTTEAPSTGNSTTESSAATTQVLSPATQTEAPTAETFTKCKAPARSLPKKV